MNANVKKLVKDVLIAMVSAGICTALLASAGTFTAAELIGAFFGLMLLAGGIPAGWKFSSKFISAVSIKGVLIKLVLSLVLGWIVFPITLIKDVICLFRRPAPQA